MSGPTSGFGWLAYRLALGAGMAVAAPVFMAKKGGHYRRTLRGRIGLDLGPADGVERLWIHAVSVGEAAVAATLVRKLPTDLPVVLTTVTPTGQDQAAKALKDRAEVAYLPFDLERPVRRFVERYRPRGLVLVEGDYWPLTLAQMAQRGRIAVVNGRMSDRAFKRQAKIGGVNQLFYRHVERFGLQSEEDRRRLEQLGVPADRLRVTGNLKYDAAEPPRREDLESLVLGIADGRPVIVAGSTMDGEEEPVLAAHRRLATEGTEALLIVAPRHPERWPAVAALLEADGRPSARRSALGEPPSPRIDVLLLDSLGELAGLYRLAQAAFIGGTLVPTGGHNPLEPARFAVPTVVGPSMENFQEMAEHFDAEGAWRRVTGAAQLGDAWGELLSDPALARTVGGRAKALLDANRGALDKSLDLIAPLIDDVARRRPR
ncbi:MAG: 3-deoxy-D-manno-octulosonic acid transferase [Acidobacteriota bacterium]